MKEQNLGDRLRHDVALTDGCDGWWTRPVREPLWTPGHSGGLWASVEAREATQSAFDCVLDVNLKGAMFQARRYMVRQGVGGK